MFLYIHSFMAFIQAKNIRRQTVLTNERNLLTAMKLDHSGLTRHVFNLLSYLMLCFCGLYNLQTQEVWRCKEAQRPYEVWSKKKKINVQQISLFLFLPLFMCTILGGSGETTDDRVLGLSV